MFPQCGVVLHDLIQGDEDHQKFSQMLVHSLIVDKEKASIHHVSEEPHKDNRENEKYLKVYTRGLNDFCCTPEM